VLGLNSFKYILYPVGFIGPPFLHLVPQGQSFVDLISGDLSLDTEYQWNVVGCTDLDGNDCLDAMGAWNWASPPGMSIPGNWVFKTTGGPPTLILPNDGDVDVVIPVNFDWQEVSGAKSYRIQVSDDSLFANIVKEQAVLLSEISVDYPTLATGTDYWWRVQSCADEFGSFCGSTWGGPRKLTTFDIKAPDNPNPPDGAVIDEAKTITLSWDSVAGAKAYHIIVILSATGKEIFNETISSNSFSRIPTSFPEIGWYEWKVQACLDAGCGVAGSWSTINNGGNPWTFNLLLIAPPGMGGGLVPCGRQYDDLNTPWNERDRCQIPHLFLLMRNVLDFVLWKIATIMLVLILVSAGAIFYLSMGEPTTITKVRVLLKSAAIGYVVIFAAWFLINLILGLLGYKFQIFGYWFDLPSPF